MKSVLILGAKGCLGRETARQFINDGWRVILFARIWSVDDIAQVTHEMIQSADVHFFAGDALKASSVHEAVNNCNVILNAINPPFPAWEKNLPLVTQNVIQAALASNARVLLPGNIYNYGEGMPVELNEQTPMNPTTRKGQLRCELEKVYQNKSVRTIVIRAGDYLNAQATDNWFDTHMLKNIDKDEFTYPGPKDCQHSWAYIPDLAQTFVAIANREASFRQYEEFCFPGYTLTGHELISEVEKQLGKSLTVKNIPWRITRIMGKFQPMLHEIAEMEYLWRVDHALKGQKLKSIFPDFEATELSFAFENLLKRFKPEGSPH